MSAAKLLKTRWRSLAGRVHDASPRERVMLVLLGAMAVLIVLALGVKLLRIEVDRHRTLTLSEEKTARVLEMAPTIDASIEERSGRLGRKRFSTTDFFAAVDTLARESGLTSDASSPRSQTTAGLTIHRMRLTLRGATLEKLMDFDDRLRLRGDGIVIESVALESRSRGEIGAVYELAVCQPGK